MRIDVVDPGGHGIGLTIGLIELGHVVRYRGALADTVPTHGVAALRAELIERYFGDVAGSGDGVGRNCDCLVLVDTFADYLHGLTTGVNFGGTNAVRHPLQDDAGVLIYPSRLQHFVDLCRDAPQVAVLDASDHSDQREIVFEAFGAAHLFAREGALGDRWQPFPFLFNTAMLWAEFLKKPREWFLPSHARDKRWDWAFCGTIDHGRYSGNRSEIMKALPSLWPNARGLVQSGVGFLQVLETLQSTHMGLDLPGAGELCFRLHENLALGTPVWRPMGGRVPLPIGLQPVVVEDPGDLPSMDAEDVRAIYDEHYSPRAAAEYLLRTMAASDQNSIVQATNIAAAASR